MTQKTLFDKIWDAHVVKEVPGGVQVVYVDRHFIHEVTSPQAFDGLKKRGLPVFRPKQTIATADHNVPTKDQHLPIRERLSRFQDKTPPVSRSGVFYSMVLRSCCWNASGSSFPVPSKNTQLRPSFLAS